MSEESGATLDGIAQWYTDALIQHGSESRAVGWKDGDSQRLRFDKLIQGFLPAPPGPIAVNDLGCGYGAMFDYLDESSALVLGDYFGYDISASMLEVARQRTEGDHRAHWLLASHIESVADISVVSGTFNVLFGNSEAAWRQHVERALDNMFEHSRLGFAFNLLSTYVDWKQDGLYYGDPLEYFDLCKRRYSRQVALFHDYPLYEWTICVRYGHAL